MNILKRIRVMRIARFLSSPTGRLAESYLLIIMLMSIGFSLVFFIASSRQLGRQFPPDELIHRSSSPSQTASDTSAPTDDDANGHELSHSDLEKFLHQRIDEGRTELKYRLVYVNAATFVAGALLSYMLARRTLRPIEEAMEAQAQFVSDASHELRTPLTAIQTSNEVALRKPKLSVADLKQLVLSNNEDIARLQQLSEGLLSLAQRTKTKHVLQPVSLQDVTAEAMTPVVHQASARGISVHDEVANITVMASQSALAQVLVILLDNAVKYSPPKTKVILRSRTKGRFAYIDVIDEGVGIRASDMPHLFRRFYRADSARTSGDQNGYGLGLAIAESIMKNHEGEITVTSQIGQGSTFTIKLPLANR